MFDATRRTLLLAAGLAFGLAAACQNPEPNVEMRVCGDVDVPHELDSLRISLLGADRTPRREGVLELVECPEGEVRRLPQSVSFRPFDGRAWAVVEGLREGRPELRFERRLELSADASATIRLAANRDCLGIACPEGQTCVGGECELAPRSGSPPASCESAKTDGTLSDAGVEFDGDAAPSSDAYDPGDGGDGGDTGTDRGDASVPAPILCSSRDTGTEEDTPRIDRE
jgi:hypothetical protein